MKKLTVIIALIAMGIGFGPVHAAGAKAFLETIDKSMKISGQMASGRVPYNPARAVKEMENIQKAVKAFESSSASAPKNIVSCASKLKKASLKGATAAKAGQGAFKAAYGDLLNGYKGCQEK